MSLQQRFRRGAGVISKTRGAAAQIILLYACTTLCQSALAGAATLPTVPVCQSIVVPSYFHPRLSGSAWNTLIADPPHSGKVNRVLIVNPNSGPGKHANADFLSAVERVHRSGQKVYGYVPTGYGARPMRAVQQQVTDYVAWYGVDGIFVDEVSDKASLVKPYYQPLSTFITSHIKGGDVILNNGTYPDASYAEIKIPTSSTLQLVVFEHDFGAFTAPSYRVPSWIRKHPSSMFVSIVYATNSRQLRAVLQLSASRNIGSVYVTDHLLPNPYGALPSYWSALDHDTQTGCSK